MIYTSLEKALPYRVVKFEIPDYHFCTNSPIVIYESTTLEDCKKFILERMSDKLYAGYEKLFIEKKELLYGDYRYIRIKCYE